MFESLYHFPPLFVRFCRLYELVKKHMVHKPCDPSDPAYDPQESHPCHNSRGVCSKRFPYAFQAETTCPENSFAQTRRRAPEDGGFTIKWKKKNGEECEIDNRWIVRHNPKLLMKYNCHLNCEVSGCVDSVKYICKYFTKGHDMSCFQVIMEEFEHDEIEQYKNGRFITAFEAHWDLYGLTKYDNTPSVKRLDLHLPNMQSIMHEDHKDMSDDRLEHLKRTTLTSFFELNASVAEREKLPDPRDVLYQNIPRSFTWNYGERDWQRRKQGTQIGRIRPCNFRATERWAERKLLLRVSGFTSFDDMKTVPKDEDINFMFDDDDFSTQSADHLEEHKSDDEDVNMDPNPMQNIEQKEAEAPCM